MTDSDILAREILKRIASYRTELFSEYVTPPLRMGTGYREFEILNLFIPVVGVGPKNSPVPSGSLVEADNTPRFVADQRLGRDCIMGLDTRIRGLNDVNPVTGAEVIPETAQASYKAHESNHQDAAGAGAIVAGIAGTYCEIVIWYAQISGLQDAVGEVELLMDFTATAGALDGQEQTIVFHYCNDVTNGIYKQDNYRIFPNGKRILATTAGAGINGALSGGSTNEVCTIGISYRHI